MIRRLLEIETYRMMASLTLSTAKQLSQELDAFDKTLVCLSERSAGVDGHDSKGLLEAIAHLSRQVVSRTVKPVTALAPPRPTHSWCSNAWGVAGKPCG